MHGQKQKIRGFLIWKCRMRDIRILCQRDPGIIRECWTGRFSDQGNVPDTGICLLQDTYLQEIEEDIFQKDLARYTFTEQCEEVAGLKLDDGITKIFLNMTSKKGSPELISLLQYMKNTDIDNPEIEVKDERLLELDRIVNEVKESEEWEAVKMDILDVGIQRGMELGRKQGIEQGIIALIETCHEFEHTKEETVSSIMKKFELSEETARNYVEKYWKE